MIPKSSLLLMAVLAMAGCTSAGKHVYIASDTTLGVIGAMNTAQTSGKLIIGYDRQFIAVVPKKQVGNDIAGDSTAPAPAGSPGAGTTPATTADSIPVIADRPGDVLSTYNCTHLSISGITVTKFYEHLATGPASIALASRIPASTDGNECSFNLAPATDE